MTFWLILLLCLSSCTSVREAQQVVATADSLRTAGVQYTDSTAVAEAVATLEPFRLFFPTDYAHANYYYGRILRTQGNQPEAMLAFLRVVHSRTKDHVIKGRSYCNMGIMCGLATEHELAYDMYECSAQEFLLANDSVAYYYALIDMALALAENKQKDESLELTDIIKRECINSGVLIKTLEARAAAYIYAEQYDSVIYYITILQQCGNLEPTGLLLKARSFSCIGQKDSAVYYAQKVVDCTNSLFDLNNAYYILANDDEHKNKEEALQVAADRSDVQKLIEIRQGQLSQATQLLQQDLNRKPNLGWLFAIIGTSAAIGVGIAIYVKRKRRKRQLLSQQIAAQERQQVLLMEQNQNLIQQKTKHNEKALAEIEIFCNAITIQNIKVELCWDDFDKMCSTINIRMFGLADKLTALGILNEREIRLCILIALGNFRDKEMAEILFYGENSIRTVKTIVAKKLGTTGKELRSFLLNQVVF